MTPIFRRLCLLASVAALPLVAAPAHAQSNDTRYGTWAPPGTTAGTAASAVTQDAKLDALLKELKALVADAEKARAADRLFLRDLKDLAARYENPWTQRLLFDDFSDNELMRNPTWSITSGEYWVEQGYGLRSRSTAATQQQTQERQVTKEEAIIGILGAVLQGAAKNNGSGGGTATTTTTTAQAKPAVIETRARIANAFALNLELSSWKAEGAFETGVTQGTSGAGYRVVYTPAQASGQNPKLELVRVTARGRGIVDTKAIAALEDNKVHQLAWTRAADGSMAVSLDGTAVLSARDTGFRDAFDGLTIVNAGTDIIVKSIDVMGAP